MLSSRWRGIIDICSDSARKATSDGLRPSGAGDVVIVLWSPQIGRRWGG